MRFTENRNTKSQRWWVIIVRFIGLVMFIAPIYKPLVYYFKEDVDIVVMTTTDIGFGAVGFMLFAGGKNLGILANNIGTAINNFLQKLTK